MSKIELQRLKDLLDSNQLAIFDDSDPGYAEYIDEDNPNAGIVIRQSNGLPMILMPLDVYEDLMAMNKDKQNE